MVLMYPGDIRGTVVLRYTRQGCSAECVLLKEDAEGEG